MRFLTSQRKLSQCLLVLLINDDFCLQAWGKSESIVGLFFTYNTYIKKVFSSC